MSSLLASDARSSSKPTFVSPPRVPPRGQTPEKLQKKPVGEILKPVDPAPVIAKKVDEAKASETTSSQEIKAPRLHLNHTQNDLKLSAPKLRIDPEVVVQKPVKVPAIAREPMKVVSKEVVQKVAEVQKIDEVKKVAEEVKNAPEDAKKIKTADTEKKTEAEKPKTAKIIVANPSEEGKTSEEVKSVDKKLSDSSKSTQARLMYSDLKKFEWSTDKNVNVKIITMLEANVFTLCEVREAMDEYYKYIDDSIAKYCQETPDIVAYNPM